MNNSYCRHPLKVNHEGKKAREAPFYKKEAHFLRFPDELTSIVVVSNNEKSLYFFLQVGKLTRFKAYVPASGLCYIYQADAFVYLRDVFGCWIVVWIERSCLNSENLKTVRPYAVLLYGIKGSNVYILTYIICWMDTTCVTCEFTSYILLGGLWRVLWTARR